MTIEIKRALFERLVEKAPETIKELAKKAAVEDLEEWIKIRQERSSDKNYPRVLQDLVNIAGERLGFNVTFGEYGRGPDGIWKHGETNILVEVKASSYHLDVSSYNGRISSEGATCGVAICPEFLPDRVAAAKQYPKIRLLTSSGLCKLVKLKEAYQFPTQHIVNVLVPQETVQLNGLVELVYGIMETEKEERKPSIKEDKFDINAVPDNIKDLGDVAKAMYLILKQNPEKEFVAEELSKQIFDSFPKTFAGRSIASISFGSIWSGDALERRGYVTVKRVRPEPEKYPEWVQRSYKFKGKGKEAQSIGPACMLRK